MKAQMDLMEVDALARIRNLPDGKFLVPSKGFAYKRAIAVAMGAAHLDRPEIAVEDDASKAAHTEQHNQLDAYVNLVNTMVDDGLLQIVERVELRGPGGVLSEKVEETMLEYSIRPQVDDLLDEAIPSSSIDSAEDLLELIEEESSLVYHTTFERGARPFTCSLAKYCGEDDSRTNDLLDFERELLEAGRITEVVEPYIGRARGSKGEIIENIPSRIHVLRVA